MTKKTELKEELKEIALSIQELKNFETNFNCNNQLDYKKVRTYIIGNYFNYESSQTKKLEGIYNKFQLSSYFPYDEEFMIELIKESSILKGSESLKPIRKYQKRGTILSIILYTIFCGSFFSYFFLEESKILLEIMFITAIPSIMLPIPVLFSYYERKFTDSIENDTNKAWKKLYKDIGGEAILEYQNIFKNLLDHLVELQEIGDLDFLMPIYKEEVLTQDFSIIQTGSITNDKPKSLRKLKEDNHTIHR